MGLTTPHVYLISLLLLIALTSVSPIETESNLLEGDASSSYQSSANDLETSRVLPRDNNNIQSSDNNVHSSYLDQLTSWYDTAVAHFRRKRDTKCSWWDFSCKVEKATAKTEASTATTAETSTTPTTDADFEETELSSSNLIDIDSEESLQRNTRSTQPANEPSSAVTRDKQYVDDEDLVTQDDSSGDPLQGSGELPIQTPPTPHLVPGQAYFYRISLTLTEPFNDDFLNRSSELYKRVEATITKAFQDLLKDISSRHSVNLINIRKDPGDPFQMHMSVDVGIADYRQKDEVLNRIRREVEEFHRIGPYVAKPTFTYKEFGAGSVCNPGEIACRSGNECIEDVKRCDEVSDCADGSDEEGCGPTSVPSTTTTTTTTAVPVLNTCRGDESVQCPDGSGYICLDQVCDGTKDCISGFDERNCSDSDVCPDGEFVCDVTRCLPHASKCDKILDCTDGTDEKDCPPTEAKCFDEQMQCSDLKCIDSFRRCDGHDDCSDGADEKECPCSEDDEFTCDNGSCIEIERKCDNVRDCPDGEDEEGCSSLAPTTDTTTTTTSTTTTTTTKAPTPACRPNQFQCRSGDCIDDRLRCNTQADCPYDDSDEETCTPQGSCKSSEFPCRDGTCLPGNLRCDKVYNCPDKSDETECPCMSNEFQCNNRHCIPAHKRCDGIHNCNDLSDEANCTSCSGGDQFLCRDGRCISALQRCNGIAECSEGDDEVSCPPRPPAPDSSEGTRCPDTDFTCADGVCVPLKFRCDGTEQCVDSSDEVNCPRFEPTTRPACGDDQFTCTEGSCVSDKYRCDSVPDCPDRSDETNCPELCTPDDVKCGDGRCLSPTKKCDLVLDCDDGEDEIDCGLCNPGDFVCSDGSCVPETRRCDGVSDCRDGSDEKGCVTSCRSDEWRCLNGLCLAGQRYCDGRVDCPDGSDEEGCPTTPPPPQCNEFLCSSGACIPKNQVCDGFNDCSDNSDEQSCARPTPPPPCRSDEFTCSNGSCIPRGSVCDRRYDCSDGSDEERCPPQPCRYYQFTCTDGSCIDSSVKCNGRSDCSDGSDERDCGSCRSGEWQCDITECIDISHKCDNIYDCRDFSDEQNCLGCRADEYQCRSGECLPSYLLCDNIQDCRDNSDENNCSASTPSTPVRCASYEFACYSGDQCVLGTERCDGKSDCRDDSDEVNCACQPGYFRCENGPCIAGNLVCNGRVDCPYDTSDEMDCPRDRILHLVAVPKDQIIKDGREVVFQCRDEGYLRASVKWTRGGGLPLPPGSRDIRGRLEIPNVQLDAGGTYVCEAEGYPKTPGQSVSVFLKVEPSPVPPMPPRKVCGSDEATCNNWDCIRKDQICDGHMDCRDGSDELRCGNRGQCEPNQFKCASGQCVRKDWLCDGQTDCMDGEDERQCIRQTNSSCLETEFECASQTQCVPKYMHCDGEIDCHDASDESQCNKPEFVQVPPGLITVDCHAENVVNITCIAAGGPVPVVSWRRNWAHIPSNCKEICINGVSHLICANIRETEQGAYSCEAYSSKGHVFATPDTQIICREDHPPTTRCPPGTFNVEAVRRDECINCFCFGKGTRCTSADLFVYQIPPPFSQYRIIGVDVAPDGSISIRQDISLSTPSLSLRNVNSGFQIYSASQTLRPDFTPSVIAYFVLPEVYQRNQLKSYGGYFNFTLRYNGNGRPITAPDVIVVGNGITLTYSSRQHGPGQEERIGARFWPRTWNRQGSRGEEFPASREDIMMTLADVQYILIRAQYVDGEVIDTTVTDVRMDSAGVQNTGLGKAAYVEKCDCPVGYQGLSCEECSPGFSKTPGDPVRSECRRDVDITCPAGTYGNPGRGIPCQSCPCPLTNPSNQFARTCYLDTDGQVTCNCPQGYIGRRCERCDRDYSGNPNLPGDYCRPQASCDAAGSKPGSYGGQCSCKDFVSGPYCDRCQDGTFHLTASNPSGCTKCFCSGVTRECDSSTWYREQVSAAFTRDARGFKLVEADNKGSIDSMIHVDMQTKELVYQDFSPSSQQVYYWSLPALFLGDKVTAYGGYLNYTLRYDPTPGGHISKNTAADVIINSINDVVLSYYHRGESLDPNRPQTLIVPLVEQYWQRNDGQATNREHFIMALSDLGSILIKATYTTGTKEAAILRVSLDTAVERNTGQSRALEVEQCVCPTGYRGLSCEDCDVGYTRTGEGLYLGTCQPCNCGNRSFECDPETGVCKNCRDGTTGDDCEDCLDGYYRKQNGGGCIPRDERPCVCNYKGSVTQDCQRGQCPCKPNVEGQSCDRCRPGFFGLEELGECMPCFCSDVTQDCHSSTLSRIPIPMQILSFDPNHGFTLTDSARRVIIRSGFTLNDAKNEISYASLDNLPSSRQSLYWSLPPSFTGNKVASYGGSLSLSQRFTSQDVNPRYSEDADVILTGNGLTLFWKNRLPLLSDSLNTYNVPLLEGSWTRADPTGPRTASRTEIMTVLAGLESIQIRANPFSETDSTALSDVALDTAVDQNTGEGIASHVEQCRCPPGYRGTSCESCATGYYRDTTDRSSRSALGICKRCLCNSREESCVLEGDGRVLCSCRPGYTGRNCENEGPVRPEPGPPTPPPAKITVSIAEPVIQLIQGGSTVRFKCSGRSLDTGLPVSVRWSKDGGELPRGRAIDDQMGVLVITDVQDSDAGVYICQATYEDSIVTNYATLQVDSEASPPTRPEIEADPPYREVREGDSVQLICNARGTPRPDIRWTHIRPQPQGLYGLGTQALVSGSTFNIPSVRKSDEGQYACTATNSAGESTAYIQLIVRSSYPPEAPIRVTIDPPEYNGPETTVQSFACQPSRYNLVWSRQGERNLPSSASQRDGVLTFYNLSPADSGIYVCNASDPRLGSYGSSILRVSVSSVRPPPSVQVDPEEQTVFQGLTAELRCLHRSSPRDRVVWSRLGDDTLPIGAIAQGSTLRFSRLDLTDRGTYVCTVETPLGRSQAMGRLEVEAREAPTVELHPEAFNTVVEGGGVLIQCIVTGGIPSPTIKWSRQDGRPATGGAVVEEPDGILRINRVTQNDGGVFICHADNAVGSVSATATIDVLVPPSVNLSPATRTNVVEGQRFRLDCRASGKPAPTVSWLRYTINHSKSVYETTNITNEQPLSVVYSVSSATRADEGTYVCVAKNSAGTAQERVLVVVDQNNNNLPNRGDIPDGGEGPESDELIAKCVPIQLGGYSTDVNTTITITIEDRPELPSPAYEYTVTKGGRSEIRCSAGRNSEAQYLDWKRSDRRPLPRDSYVRDGSLFITNAQPEDAGEYLCIGMNRDNEILFTAAATIIISSPPRITLEPVRQVVRPGDQAQIMCTASGDDPMSISWAAVERRMPPGANNYDGLLQFRSISVDDAGKYLCKAINNAGEAEAIAEVEVLAMNYQILAENRDQSATVGSSAQLRCIVQPDAGGRQPSVRWSRAGGPLPYGANPVGEVLQLSTLRVSDSDRYTCEIDTPQGITSDYINLRVNSLTCKWNQFHCKYPTTDGGSCIDRQLVCDGHRDCPEGSDEADCSRSSRKTRRGVYYNLCSRGQFHCRRGSKNGGKCIDRKLVCDGKKDCHDGDDEVWCHGTRIETHAVSLSIQPSIASVREGDHLRVMCLASGVGPGAKFSWTRVGGKFESNTLAYGNDLRFSSVREKNGGLYRCKVKTADQTYSEDYVLSIADNDNSNHIPPSAEIKMAPYGKMLELECKSDLSAPVAYSWQKQGGSLPKDSYTREQWLVISDVRAQDAGTYVCHASNPTMKISVPIILVVTGVVPYFPQAPSSYMGLPTIPDSQLDIDLEISFKPETPDGLILYNGQSRGENTDFVSLGINKGIVEFRFNPGSGPAVIRSQRPIILGQWHTVNISRSNKEGSMTVDGDGPFTGTSQGTFQSLDLAEPLFIGGVPDFKGISRFNGFVKGFVGCVSRLSIGGIEHDLVRDATLSQGVTTCETCADSPCLNRGVCQEAATTTGYTCLCPSGFGGQNCDKVGETCYTGACGNGRCVNHPDGFQCRCPFGLEGNRCQKEVNIVNPFFSGDAFVAYPTPKTPRKIKTSLTFSPHSLADGVLLYASDSTRGSGKFNAIVIKDGRLEYRFDSGSGTKILRGSHDLSPGDWTSVTTIRDGREARLLVDQLPPVTIRSDGYPLNLRTPLYIGGYDRENITLASGVGTQRGFQGCIEKVEVSGVEIDAVKSIVDSSNVQDCQIARELSGDPCLARNPCLNNGKCHSQGGSYECACPTGYTGQHCEREADMCQIIRPCKNGARCEGTSSSYKCHCTFGFTGATCSKAIELSTSVSFMGDGFVELSKDLLAHRDERDSIVIEFTTNGGDGLLLWHGQERGRNTRGSDFLSVAVEKSHLVLRFELGSGPAQIISKERIVPGRLHRAVLSREGSEGTLTLDNGETTFGNAEGMLSSLNTAGNIYVGGVPDYDAVTGGHYTRGLNGCIQSLELGESGHIHFRNSALSSSNVRQCPSFGYDDGEEIVN